MTLRALSKISFMGLLMTENKYKKQIRLSFGKYKGFRIEEVPADYLIWLLENGCNNDEVREYIEENEDDLRLEMEHDKRFGR